MEKRMTALFFVFCIEFCEALADRIVFTGVIEFVILLMGLGLEVLGLNFYGRDFFKRSREYGV